MEMGVFPANRDLREARARTLRARSDSDSRRRCVNCLSHTERPQDVIETDKSNCSSDASTEVRTPIYQTQKRRLLCSM